MTSEKEYVQDMIEHLRCRRIAEIQIKLGRLKDILNRADTSLRESSMEAIQREVDFLKFDLEVMQSYLELNA